MDEVPKLEFSVDGQVLTLWIRDSLSMIPPHVDEVSAAIQAAAKSGPVGLLAIAAEELVSVDFRVPMVWLEKTRDPSYAIKVIAVVTKRMAVRAVVNAFQKTNALLNVPLKISAFPEEAAAREWLTSTLAG